MPPFQKKNYTAPVISQHNNDLSKDWYVFFRFKHNGKTYKFKRREGINRVKKLRLRVEAIQELLESISVDLKYGWNPVLDRKREMHYSHLKTSSKEPKVKKIEQQAKKRKMTNAELDLFYFYGSKG